MSGHDGLREALERIAALSPKGPFAFPSDELAEAQAIARAALAATPPASDPVGLDVERLAEVLNTGRYTGSMVAARAWAEDIGRRYAAYQERSRPEEA
jgi:hypothetical protein